MGLLNSIVLCLLLVCMCQSTGVPTQAQWDAATQKAKAYLTSNQLTNTEKSNLATGVGWEHGQCVGNIPAITRVNFNGFCLEDSPTGVRFARNVTGFPAAINVASTWNRSLIYERAAAIGNEHYNKGVHIALAPMMNMGRVACGGRNWEGFGADPYLTGEAAYQSVLGIQDQGVVATAKHYLLNEQEHYRTTSSSDADERTMHEIYMYPFLQSVRAGVGSVMCSYNQVNGVYACENDYILNQVLKKEFNFQGYVMSDWSATMSGVPSVVAGLDMTMPGDVTFDSGTTYFGQNLVNAVSNGQVTQARLDDMATRILTPFFLLGQDQSYPTVDFDFRNAGLLNQRNAQGNHADVVRRIGAQSSILLKHINNVLPLATHYDTNATYTIAVIGSDGGPSPGSYGPNACSDHGCNNGTLAQGWGSGTVWFPYLVDPNEAITAQAKMNNQTVISSLTDSIPQGQAAAAQAEICIVFVSADSGEGYITVEGNFGDRNDLYLWHNGDLLIEAVASVCRKTIVVMHVVGPVLLPWIDHPNITDVILAGLPGQETGNSLVDVLWGAENPSAKLVYTIAKQAGDYPASVLYDSSLAHPPINYTEQLLIDYRWFDQKNIAPQFEFGFGLSYTTFNYSNLQFTPVTSSLSGCTTKMAIDNDVLYTVAVDVANTGSYDGAEVVQLYLVYPASAGEPPKVLRGFEKVWVNQGSTTTASFSLTRLDVSIWDPSFSTWVVPAGDFQVWIGASSRDLRLSADFSISPIPSVTYQANTYTIVEGQSLTLTLSLSSASTQTISVPVWLGNGTAPAGDYSVDTMCVTFAPGATQANITITTVDDHVYRGTTNFYLSFQPPTNANLLTTSQSTIQIQDNQPTVSVAANSRIVAVSEGVGKVNITLQLSDASVFPTKVTWTLSGHPNLNDISFPNPFTIPTLVTSMNMPITVVEDRIYEGNETFVLTITTSSNSSIDTSSKNVTLTVIDDDPVPIISLTSSNPTLTIEEPTASASLSLSNPEEGAIVVGLVPSYMNSSQSGISFSAISGFPSVTIATNTSTVLLEISTRFDNIYEGNTVFSVSLGSVTAGVATLGSADALEFTIVENMPYPSVSFTQSSIYAVTAGINQSIPVVLAVATNQDIVVPYSTVVSLPSGLSFTSGSITFDPLSQNQTIYIYLDPTWTAPATITLEAPTSGPAVLGAVTEITIYNLFSDTVSTSAITTTTAAAVTTTTTGVASSTTGTAATTSVSTTTQTSSNSTTTSSPANSTTTATSSNSTNPSSTTSPSTTSVASSSSTTGSSNEESAGVVQGPLVWLVGFVLLVAYLF